MHGRVVYFQGLTVPRSDTQSSILRPTPSNSAFSNRDSGKRTRHSSYPRAHRPHRNLGTLSQAYDSTAGSCVWLCQLQHEPRRECEFSSCRFLFSADQVLVSKSERFVQYEHGRFGRETATDSDVSFAKTHAAFGINHIAAVLSLAFCYNCPPCFDMSNSASQRWFAFFARDRVSSLRIWHCVSS